MATGQKLGKEILESFGIDPSKVITSGADAELVVIYRVDTKAAGRMRSVTDRYKLIEK